MKHAVITTFLAVLVAGLGGAPWHAEAAPPRAVPVFVTDVGMQSTEDRIEALGTLRANESVELTVLVTETIGALHFDDGDRVEAGRILVEMTSDEERALIREARATTREALGQYERIRSLRKEQKAAQSLLDQRLRELETARARLAALESRMEDRVVRAPFAGIVGLRKVSRGALVEPGDIITTLDDDSVMKLDFSVPAVYLDALALGLPVTAVAPAWPARAFTGRVRSIDSRIDPVTRTVVVRALFDNPEHLLRPGMLMRVEMRSRRRDAIVIPEECLLPRGARQFVYVVDADNTVHKREVTIGQRFPGGVEIVDGLKVGEKVITDGGLKVRPGSKVSLRARDDGRTPIRQLLGTQPARKAGE